jgi:uncharacterized protein YceK
VKTINDRVNTNRYDARRDSRESQTKQKDFKMKKLALSLALTSMLSGCATIISENDYAVEITAEKPGTVFKVTDSKGRVVHMGNTPQTVTLESDASYFVGESYLVDFEEEQQTRRQLIESELDNWYFGNILLGGFIGALLVDPISGYMWELPTYVHAEKGSFEDYEEFSEQQSLILVQEQ